MQDTKIGILANFNPNYRPHAAMNCCFEEQQDAYGFSFEWLPTEALDHDAATILRDYKGIIAGSGPYKSKTGVINGIRYARLNNVPFMGTCSGFGYAVLEFGQHLFGLPEVFHPYERPELAKDETFLQPLNDCPTELVPIQFRAVESTMASAIYGNGVVTELSHCTYGVNPDMLRAFAAEGFVASCLDKAYETKVIEYSPNDFYMVTLFLPQLRSSREVLHPMIQRFLQTTTGKFEKSDPLS